MICPPHSKDLNELVCTDLKRCCGLPLEVVHRGLFRHLNWSKNWRNPPETTQALRPWVSEEDTTGYKALMLPLSKGKIVASDANAHIWDIWHWHKEQNSPNPQRARAFCWKHFVPREFIWVGYSLDQVKSITLSSPAPEASSLAVQHRGEILSEIYSNIISSTVISLVEILLKDHLQSVIEFLLNGSWEAWAIFFQGLAKHESLLDPANPPGLGFASLFRDLAVDPLLTPPRETDMLVIFIHIQH